MNPTLESLWIYLGHVMDSIVLFDQKSAAIIAISVGTLFVFHELTKGRRQPADLRKWWTSLRGWSIVTERISAAAGTLFLVVALGIAVFSIFPPAGHADAGVSGVYVPHTVVKSMTLDEFKEWVRQDPQAKNEGDELATLVWSRLKIREWKAEHVRWSIFPLGAGIIGLFLTVLLAHLRPNTEEEGGGKASSDFGSPPEGGVTEVDVARAVARQQS